MIAVSQGGMIAQVLAKRYPELVSRLVLVTTADKVNDTMKQTVEGWINLAELGRNKELFLDMMAKTFSDSYLKKYRWLLPLLASRFQLKDPKRLYICANPY